MKASNAIREVALCAEYTYKEFHCVFCYFSSFARLWLDSQHDNLPKGIRTIKMCKLYSNDARCMVTANGLASIVKENV